MPLSNTLVSHGYVSFTRSVWKKFLERDARKYNVGSQLNLTQNDEARKILLHLRKALSASEKKFHTLSLYWAKVVCVRIMSIPHTAYKLSVC